MIDSPYYFQAELAQTSGHGDLEPRDSIRPCPRGYLEKELHVKQFLFVRKIREKPDFTWT
jgi:hypothetical protein